MCNSYSLIDFDDFNSNLWLEFKPTLLDLWNCKILGLSLLVNETNNLWLAHAYLILLSQNSTTSSVVVPSHALMQDTRILHVLQN